MDKLSFGQADQLCREHKRKLGVKKAIFSHLFFPNFTNLIDLRLTPYFILKIKLASHLCLAARCKGPLPIFSEKPANIFHRLFFQIPKRRESLETTKDQSKKHDYAFSERFLSIFHPRNRDIHAVHRIQFPDPAGNPRHGGFHDRY